MRCSMRILTGAVALIVVLSGARVATAQMQMKVPEDQVMAMSKYSFDETISKVKRAIEGQNMMILYTADMQQMLKMVGLETKGMQTIIFFHPRYGKEIYTKARMAGIEPPLKVTIMENDQGKTVLRYRKPSAIFAPYAPLKDLGKELDDVLGEIQAAVTQ